MALFDVTKGTPPGYWQHSQANVVSPKVLANLCVGANDANLRNVPRGVKSSRKKKGTRAEERWAAVGGEGGAESERSEGGGNRTGGGAVEVSGRSPSDSSVLWMRRW